MIHRRSFITGLVSLVAAPAIVRAGSLMPVKVFDRVNMAELIDALLNSIERTINPPYGLSPAIPAMQALQYLDEHDRIISRIISADEYLVGR